MCYDAYDWEPTPEEFIEVYSFIDREQIYTNGSKLIPVFRVEDMLEHYYKERTCKIKRHEVYGPSVDGSITRKLLLNCSKCGKRIGITDNYCRKCGARVVL